MRSRSCPPRGPFGASPAPSTRTFGRFSDLATSGEVTISAPPPSVTTQQSSRCSGSAIIRELTTSSTVTTSFRKACSFHWAWWLAATLIQASCSLVVPYSYMWRMAHMP